MKRDMDLIRQILLEAESRPWPGTSQQLAIDGFSADVLEYHARLAVEAGLMEVEFCDNFAGCVPWRLTWSGHGFLDAAREGSFWSTWKKVVTDAGLPLTLEILKTSLSTIVLRMLGKK